jgi:hypothetical protein
MNSLLINKDKGNLTGNTRFRLGFRKKLILQVEYKYFTDDLYGTGQPGPDGYCLGWKDATLQDITLN